MLVVGDAYLTDVTAGVTRQRNQSIAMGIFMVMALTALLYLNIRRLVARPFANVLRAVETVGAGDLTGRVEVTSGDQSRRLFYLWTTTVSRFKCRI